VNPHSPDDIAHNIHLALDMPLAERKQRWERLVAGVREDNVQRWTDSIIADLTAIAHPAQDSRGGGPSQNR